MRLGLPAFLLLLSLVSNVHQTESTSTSYNTELGRWYHGKRGGRQAEHRSALYRLRKNRRGRQSDLEGEEERFTLISSSNITSTKTLRRHGVNAVDNDDTVKMVAESLRNPRQSRDQKGKEDVAVHIRAAQKAATGFSVVVTAMTGSCDVRLLMFVFYASLGTLMPYIPMYYKYLNIDSSYIGFFGAITPAVTFMVSPLWGILADITKRHKQIMLLTFIGSVVLRCCMVIRGNHAWLGFLVASAAILNAPVKPLLDTAVMSSLKDRAEYGKSRLFGQVGFGLGAMVGGLYLGSKDLNNMFILHAAMSILAGFLMMNFIPKDPLAAKKVNKVHAKSIEPDNTNISILSAMKIVFYRPDVLIFFFTVFIIGVSSGVIENFAYVRLSEIGAAANVLGLCRLCSSVAGKSYQHRIYLFNKLLQFLFHFVDQH